MGKSPDKGLCRRRWAPHSPPPALSSILLTYSPADIATISVNQARGRWNSLKGDHRFDAWFSQLDAYHHPLKHAASLPPEALSRAFDVVTMQFCMHYAFETEAAAHQMLDNVARYLRKGGRFIGTIPNESFLTYAHPFSPISSAASLLFLFSCLVLCLTDGLATERNCKRYPTAPG